jgi:tetratricopeptide (TPR) repeat protein
MRFAILPILLLGLMAAPASAQRYQRQDPLYQPLRPTTERALARARQLNARQAWAESIAEYDKVVEQQPRFAKAITERAFVKESVGDYAGAMADYDAVLGLAPDRAKSWSHAAWIRALRNIELDAALTYADKAVALEASIDPIDTRGFVRFRRAEWGQALADYDAVLKVFPRSASTLYMRGAVKRRVGDTAGGDTDLAKASNLDKGVERLWAGRGVTP